MMDLQRLLEWLKWQFASQQRVDAARQREAMDLNRQAPRGMDGNIQQQGLGGIFSDALPMTPQDKLNYYHPDLASIMKQAPQQTPMLQRKPYSGML